MSYCTNEGVFILPEGYEDDSVNILKFPALTSTLVITRAVLKEGMTLDKYIASQLAALKKSMKRFIAGDRQTVPFSTRTEQTALEIYCEFEQQGRKLFQYLLIADLTHQLLVMTYSQTRPFTPEDVLHWQTIKAGFSPVSLPQ